MTPDAPPPVLNRRHRLDRWYKNSPFQQELRQLFSSAAFHEAMDVARQYGAPVDSEWKQDGENTVISLALAQAEQTGWNRALNFLVSLTEPPPPGKAPMPKPYDHLSEGFTKSLSDEDRQVLQQQEHV